jgi:hypothetical protein
MGQVTRPIDRFPRGFRHSKVRGVGTGDNGAVPDTVRARLPHADPAVYLEWMAYWREIEHAMVERPALEAYASRESAPFLRDPIADWISDALAGGIIRQAGAARRAGEREVAPEISGDSLVFWAAMQYVVRRSEWLDQPGTHDAMGIEPPSAAVVSLREWAVNSLTVQLAIHLSSAPAENLAS